MPSIKASMVLNDKMSSAFTSITKAMHSTLNVMKAIKNENISAEINTATKDVIKAESALNKFINTLKNTNSQESNVSGLDSSLKGLLTTVISLKAIQGLVNTSDNFTLSTARLGLAMQSLNDDSQSVADVQNKLFASANRARTSYSSLADIVGKLGNQAKEVFGNTDDVINFSETLNKMFTVSGMDTTAIDSVMYNLTQSLSSGKLLGNDYSILKQNAPQMIQYLRQYYGDISQSALDEMVSAGKVSSFDIKQAMISASDEINEKFNSMPATWSQVWTQFKNTALQAFQPILEIISKVVSALNTVVTFLSEHKYILYVLAGAVVALAIEFVILKASLIGAKKSQWALNIAMYACPATLIILVLAVLIGVLLWLWETNDNVAYWMIYAWDVLVVSMGVAVAGIKALWLGLITVGSIVLGTILEIVQAVVNAILGVYNLGIDIANAFGAGFEKVDYANFAGDFENAAAEHIVKLSTDLGNYWDTGVMDKAADLNASREERTANRGSLSGAVSNALNAVSGAMDDVTGTDSTGNSALKVTTNDDLLSDDDIQLLLDVATRDYKLNYQQVTPEITLTFGDIRETADVDAVLDEVANRLEEIYDGSLEV